MNAVSSQNVWKGIFKKFMIFMLVQLMILPGEAFSENNLKLRAVDLKVRTDGIIQSDHKLYLKVSVWNCSMNPVSVELADLPWGQDALGLVVFTAGKMAGEPLEESRPIADFPLVDVSVKANASVSSKIDLSSRFPALSRYRNYGNLALFWIYDKSRLYGGESDFTGGMVLFKNMRNNHSNEEENPCRNGLL